MTHIRDLRLRNWRCFGGEQTLEGMRALTYAVVAQEAGNPDRSNWLGKSSLLESIRFCLTGKLAKDEAVEDWITEGAPEGGVDVELSDGTFVSRGRVRGSPTQLMVIMPDGVEKFGEAAQHALHARYFDSSVFDLSYFIGQDATSKLITMGAAERTEAVVGWIGLDKLEAAAESVQERVKLHQKELTRLEGQRDLLRRQEGNVDQLITDVDEATRHYEHAKERVDYAVQQTAFWKEWRGEQDAQQQAVEYRRELVKLKTAKISTAPTRFAEVEEEFATAQATLTDATREANRLSVLSRGAFDGVCPVDECVKCPAVAQINKRQAENSKKHDAAIQARSEAVEQRNRLGNELNALREEATAETRRETRLRFLTEHLDRVKPPLHEREPKQPQDAEEARRDLHNATTALSAAKAALLASQNATRELIAVEHRLGELTVEQAVYRAAALVLGRSGAQRLLGERVLGQIEAHANAALERAGVPLRLTVRWGRPTGKLDEHCQACGHHYGKGQAVKTCPTCATARQPAFLFALTVKLSDRSGGAQDLAGLLLQLSAARWLRAERRWDWGTYLIDEPFGAIDKANRTAIAARLHGMMEQEFGAEQALVVAHDVDTLDTLPARIQITSEGRGRSRVALVHG